MVHSFGLGCNELIEVHAHCWNHRHVGHEEITINLLQYLYGRITTIAHLLLIGLRPTTKFLCNQIFELLSSSYTLYMSSIYLPQPPLPLLISCCLCAIREIVLWLNTHLMRCFGSTFSSDLHRLYYIPSPSG